MIPKYLMGSGILYNPKKKQKENIDYQAMSKDKNQIDQLKELIKEELKDCGPHHWPHVCQMQSTPESTEILYERIINLIAKDGMGIGSAIALIEQEQAHIIIDDTGP